MLTPSERQFVQENLATDVAKLLLNPPSTFKDNIQFLVGQILSRRKAKDKLPTWFANPNLILPPPLSVEQSSSETLANYKSTLVSGELLIDLTGGMGVDCLAMSESFDKTIYVEADPYLCTRFDFNSRTLGRAMKVVNQKAESYLITRDFRTKPVIFIDPDRRSDTQKMVGFKDCSPDITKFISHLKKVATHVLVKASPLLDIKAGIRELDGVKEVHVLSVKNECKEVLFFLDFTREFGEPLIKAVNFLRSEKEVFEFRFSEEEKAVSNISDLANYLFLPNASILKAGAFNSISETYKLPKIAPNTHLYSGDDLMAGFPGRQFKVLSEKVTPDIIEEYLPQKQVNVITRNYPAKPDQILKKNKLREGGELYLIGFRDAEDKPQLVIVERV